MSTPSPSKNEQVESHPNAAAMIVDTLSAASTNAAANGVSRHQHNGLAGPNGDIDAIGYVVPDVALGTKRKVRVVTIGGGASGINMAYQIKQHMENVEHVAYEKSTALGGTWLDNRYPGCACDVPSHSYQFSFHPNTEWTHFYSGAKQICDYMNSIVDTYDLRDQFRTGHEVIDARWDDGTSQWAVTVKSPNAVFEDRCDFLVNGSGILNNWKWPNIKGIETYQGHLVHTARWDETYDYKGKNIAVIGVGSSAVQAVPQLQKQVAHMTCFIRSGAWITSAGAASHLNNGTGGNVEYTEEEKQRWREDPDEFLRYRKHMEDEINKRFPMYLHDSELQRAVTSLTRSKMAEKLAAKPELIDLLTPKFDLGCRRLTPGNGFLESLCEPNVDVVSTPIDHINERGLVTADGKEFPVDAIACATGFDVSLLPRFPFRGRNGADLKQRWTEGPVEAYMSLMVPDFPNYFTFLGPASPVAHGSLTQTIERCSIWMLKAIAKMQAEGIRSISPNAKRTRQLNIHKNAMLPTTAWNSTCSSWYKNGDANAPVIAIHPGSKLHFFEMIKDPRFEDMEIEYEAENPYSYLGNGYSLLEIEGGNDLSWFVTDPFTVNVPWSRPKMPVQPHMPCKPQPEPERAASKACC